MKKRGGKSKTKVIFSIFFWLWIVFHNLLFDQLLGLLRPYSRYSQGWKKCHRWGRKELRAVAAQRWLIHKQGTGSREKGFAVHLILKTPKISAAISPDLSLFFLQLRIFWSVRVVFLHLVAFRCPTFSWPAAFLCVTSDNAEVLCNSEWTELCLFQNRNVVWNTKFSHTTPTPSSPLQKDSSSSSPGRACGLKADRITELSGKRPLGSSSPLHPCNFFSLSPSHIILCLLYLPGTLRRVFGGCWWATASPLCFVHNQELVGIPVGAVPKRQSLMSPLDALLAAKIKLLMLSPA